MVGWRDGDIAGRRVGRAGVAGRHALAEGDPFRMIWDGMLAHLRVHHPGVCRQWFEELQPLAVAGGALELRTRSPLHRDYLKRVCSELFNDAARTVSGRLLSVRFLGPEDAATGPAPVSDRPGISARTTLVEPPAPLEPAIPPEPVVSGPRTRSAVTVHEAPAKYESLVVNPDYSFENFVVGPGCRLAHAAALAVSANPGRSYNPFFVHGGVGLGKTHLLQAVCLKIAEANPGATLYYTSCEGFVTQYFESVQSGEMSQFRHRFRDVDVLVIDDIHFLTKRDRSQEEFFHTFNSLYQASKQIILSSDAAPEDIPDLEDRLVSRFKWGLVAKVEAPDYETRIEILKTKARLRGLAMPQDAAEFIAGRIDSNIRELEGAVVKLQVQQMVEGVPVTLDLAKAALGDVVRDTTGEPTIQTIIAVVTDFYGIRLSDLQSKHRQRSIALPRHVCMYLARKCTRLSLEEIGGFFGGRDHTTVMHAVRTIEGRMEDDTDFVGVLRSLEDKLRQPRTPALIPARS